MIKSETYVLTTVFKTKVVADLTLHMFLYLVILYVFNNKTIKIVTNSIIIYGM